MTHPADQLREDIKEIIRAWLFANGGSMDALANVIYDYIIDTYGPPF